MGIPMIGCECAVCRSTDPHNRRLRTSALVEVDGLQILIDAGPDLRQQALNSGLRRVDAVLLTHAHADHIAGIDDLRPFNFLQRATIPIFGNHRTLAAVRERYSYAFSQHTSAGSTRPALELYEIQGGHPIQIGSTSILPIDVEHGDWTISGFRIGPLGYVTDASLVRASARALLHGLDTLVLNALRHTPHPTHFTIGQALELIEELRPRRTLLVHMSHELDHETANAELPPQVRLAFDGQVVEIEEQPCESPLMPG